MRLFHNSREHEYRMPYGAVAAGTAVKLALRVADAPSASVTLRTWTDAGEGLYVMAPSPDDPARYEATFTTKAPGVVWYHFIVRDEHGNEQRYGARQGHTGGEGLQLGWEPPSFQLTVYDPAHADEAPAELNHSASPAFADAVAGFLRGEVTAPALVEAIETARESYPAAAYPRVLKLLETGDPEALFVHLSGAGVAPHAAIDEALDDGQRGLAKGRLWCASLIRALMPTAPHVADAHDESDAYQPIAKRWDAVTADCETIVTNAADIRRALSLFAQGEYACVAANDDVFGFWSRGDEGCACTLINRSLHNAYDVLAPMEGEAVSEVIGGYGVPVVAAGEAGGEPRVPGSAERFARVHLTQLGSAIAYFHGRDQLAQPLEAGVGVLAHITSIPTGSCDEPDAPGTLGAPARAFADWLAEAGVRYWQVLPVNPTDNFGSPYAGISAFAGNTRLLEGGPLDSGALQAEDLPAPKDKKAYRAFCEREADWLEPYAWFMAIRDKVGAGKSWQQWPKKYRRFDAATLATDDELSARAEQWRRAQFAFGQQWEDLRAYANERGVKIIGDMPIYVSADSSDVWANPELFQLDADGNPALVAGCPPDQFAVEGQIWGNPVYDWEAARATGYAWWLRRLERAFELYDVVRLDHFIGFARYYSIPQGAKATAGTYHVGPGLEFFETAYEKFGPLPIVAEDLGLITPAVRALVAACGFPGMDIVQFVDGNDPLSGYQPRPSKIAYSGTHDNQTLVGYCEDRYPHQDATVSAKSLLQKVASCDAPVRVFPLQDLMLLNDDARMNVPGTAEGNWTWQARSEDLPRAAEQLANLQA